MDMIGVSTDKIDVDILAVAIITNMHENALAQGRGLEKRFTVFGAPYKVYPQFDLTHRLWI